MQTCKLFIAAVFLMLLLSSNSLSQEWELKSYPPAGADQFEVETGNENGSYVQFLLETSGLGLFKSTDDGTNWENIGLVGKGLTAIVDNPFNTGEYAVSTSDGIYKTTDGGTNWQQNTSGIEGLFITEIIRLVPNNNLAIGTVGNGVFTSTDGGENWQQMGTGLENKTVTSLEFIFVSPTAVGLYATTQEDGAWVYDFLDDTWAPINDGNNNLFGTTAIAGNNSNLYMAASPNIYSSPTDPVFWQQETQFDFVNTILVLPNGTVVASSFGEGIKKRRSPGVWDDFSAGLPSDNDGFIDVINMVSDGRGYIFAAIDPLEPGIIGGIYRTVNQVTGVKNNIVEAVEYFNLGQNYPNPFNPTTNIEYSLPEASFVRLKVYDLLGKEVATLVNEEQAAGSFEADFSADNLASGLYFAQLRAGNFSKTIKMNLLK